MFIWDIVSTMAYESCAWRFVDSLKRTLNGINSKMLAMITKQTIHEEAKTPSYHDVILCVVIILTKCAVDLKSF